MTKKRKCGHVCSTCAFCGDTKCTSVFWKMRAVLVVAVVTAFEILGWQHD